MTPFSDNTESQAWLSAISENEIKKFYVTVIVLKCLCHSNTYRINAKQKRNIKAPLLESLYTAMNKL